ncbi:MAG TPA: restriction endonuclease [Quisquiliibacterium sp.]|nr:restriction endonuclease [Quisquiliibacterium sp.]
MKFRMAENSLFAILLRSSWWVSFLVAGGIVLLSGLLLPAQFVVYGAIVAAPFFVIGFIAAWRQLQAPGAARIAATVERAGAMSREDFISALEEAWRREGHEVRRVDSQAADLELVKDGRTVLVACRRWKAGRTGVDPLRELQAAREARNAQGGLYVALGEVTDTARAFAARNGILLVQGAELAKLLKGLTVRRA